MAVEIMVNGESRAVLDGASVQDLLQSLQLDQKTVAVQLNDNILARGAFDGIILRPGDAVEVVRFVGGG